jgi:hypothetical protein
MFNSKVLVRLTCLLLSLPLLSCGKSSEYVNVRIITPIGMGKKFQNISEDILHFNMNPASCMQTQLFVGTSDGIESDAIFNKKISLRSQTSGCSPGGYINCLQNFSTLDTPIEINVLKGKAVDIGIVGAAYLPQDSDADGICDVDAGSESVENYSLIGHSVVNLSESQSLSLNTWVLQAYQSPTPAPGSYSCMGTYCSNKDLIHIESTDQDNMIIKKVDYFYDSITNQHVEHYLFKNWNLGADFYVPHMLPLRITYDCNAGPYNNVVIINNTNNTPQQVATCGGFALNVNGF